jgi:hypothetical protein
MYQSEVIWLKFIRDYKIRFGPKILGLVCLISQKNRRGKHFQWEKEEDRYFLINRLH